MQVAERVVRGKLEAYENVCEFWKADHDQAMMCFDFRDLLEEGVSLWGSICRLDENWRADVFKQAIPFDPSFATCINYLFHRFKLSSTVIAETLLPWFREQYAPIEHEEEFLRCHRECIALLEDSDDLPDGLAEMAEQALEDHQIGRTVEHDLA